jgi:uncharacterized protein (TIGR03083 family)
MTDRKQELHGAITAARSDALEAVARLGPDQLARPTANEGWSVKDILAHLSSIEARIRSMCQFGLDGRQWPADDGDINAYNARCVAERRSWSGPALVAELEQSGRESLSLLERLAPEDLDRTFNHPTRGVVTIETLLSIIPRHLRGHTEEIEAALGG